MSMSGAQSGPDESFGFISREGSVAYSGELSRLESRVRDIYDVPELVDFLALNQRDNVSAGAYPPHGLVGISTRTLATPEHALFLGVHESVHAKLGDTAVTRSIDPVAPGLREYFHSTLVPAWLSGEVSFRDSQAYIFDKGFDGLVPGGWHGPSDLSPEVAEGTVANYFSMAARGFILPDLYRGFIHPNIYFPTSWKEALDRPTIEPSKLAESDLQLLADVAITGFELDRQLHDWTTSETTWAWEEGVANLIASDLTGISLEEAQQHMRQDEFKIKIARRLAAAGVKGKELAEQVQSYEDLKVLVQEFVS